MKTFKILITGSRDWKDYGAVARQLAIAFADAKDKGFAEVIVMDGECETGADAMSKEFTNKVENSIPGLTIKHRGFPAKWYDHDENCQHAKYGGRCVAAGPRRNRQMVAEGPDLCLAFIKACTSSRCKKPGIHPSHGASGCAKLAEEANIPTIYTRS